MNSQFQLDPNWQPGSRTGLMSEIFDVSALTARGDVRMTLASSSVNIRDHLYPTTVDAQLAVITPSPFPSRH